FRPRRATVKVINKWIRYRISEVRIKTWRFLRDMPIPTTDRKARISFLVFGQRAKHPIVEVTREIDWKRKIGQNPVRLVRPSPKVWGRQTTRMFRGTPF